MTEYGSVKVYGSASEIQYEKACEMDSVCGLGSMMGSVKEYETGLVCVRAYGMEKAYVTLCDFLSDLACEMAYEKEMVYDSE